MPGATESGCVAAAENQALQRLLVHVRQTLPMSVQVSSQRYGSHWQLSHSVGLVACPWICLTPSFLRYLTFPVRSGTLACPASVNLKTASGAVAMGISTMSACHRLNLSLLFAVTGPPHALHHSG